MEGGPYEWVKLAMGRFWAALNTMFYWVTNPLWVGGSLAFIGTEAWSRRASRGSAPAGFSDYLFKFLFIWLTIGTAIVSLKIGKWIPTLGAIVKVGLVAFFGDHSDHLRDRPRLRRRLLVQQAVADDRRLARHPPLLLFSFVGFESANGAAEEMKDPQQDVPIAVLRSGVLSAFCYLVPILLVAARAAGQADHRPRRLPRRGQGELRDLRRRLRASCSASRASCSSSR